VSSRWRGIGLAVALLLGLLLAWEPPRVAIQTAVLLPNLLDAGPKPLGVFSPAPRRASVTYWPVDGSGPDEELAELWLPAWASAERRAGAMLLVFGVNNLGRNHPAIVRVAEGLARTGVAVLVPDSRTMLDGRLGGDEVDKIAAAFSLLITQPEVDPQRAGIVGFSVGGSLALIAATHPAVEDHVAWVNAFGAYADAATYLSSVASHSYIGTDGAPVAWQPTPLAREVFFNFMLDQVASADRPRLRDAFEEPILVGERVAPLPDLRARLRPAGRAVHDLLTAPSWEEARRAVDRLPEATREFIAAI
jgi:dienelactone hydrolase